MQTETVIAGFGGQGALFTGKVIAYTAMDKGLKVTWFPSYGPEMRGGTANCTVIFSDEEIGSPLILNPKSAIVMNQPSLDKYEPLVQKDGYLVINSSVINRQVQRHDIKIISIPGTEVAESLGNKRIANIILLGGLIANSGFFLLEEVEKSLTKILTGKKKDLLELNIQMLHKGATFKV